MRRGSFKGDSSMKKTTTSPVRKGKDTWFPGKQQGPVTSNFTPEVRKSLVTTRETTGTSVSDLLEYAWRKQVGLAVPRELGAIIASVNHG